MSENVINKDTPCAEQEWRWCLVGNIVGAHEFGEAHEIKYGTKHFSSGTKVFVNLVYGGRGHERIMVIGVPRHSRNYIEVVIPSKYVENFRIQKVFKPAVLKRMENSDYEWWGKTDTDHDRIVGFIEQVNSEKEETFRPENHEAESKSRFVSYLEKIKKFLTGTKAL
ncbi:MAG: hypothetical protein K2N71_10430 [Oscillospiraceae bacterium]|nr:hypothetical protein [Oscillospiraceae bacterium]